MLEKDELDNETQLSGEPNQNADNQKNKKKNIKIDKIDLKELIYPYMNKVGQTYFKGVNESLVIKTIGNNDQISQSSVSMESISIQQQTNNRIGEQSIDNRLEDSISIQTDNQQTNQNSNQKQQQECKEEFEIRISAGMLFTTNEELEVLKEKNTITKQIPTKKKLNKIQKKEKEIEKRKKKKNYIQKEQRKQEEKKEKEKKEEEECMVCFCEVADAVNLDCGHGGICYQCGLDVLQKTGLCYLCRQQVRQLVQVGHKQAGFQKIQQAVMITIPDESNQ